MTVIDTPVGADFFCGGGGASEGLLEAGLGLRFAANHDAVAIATHAHRHPGVDHYQVDLVEYDVAKMPGVQVAHFSPSCKHHSQANATKIYENPAMLADSPDAEARSGYEKSERSRVTMSCVLRYADAHHPPVMVVENVVEVCKWGPNRDGTTFAWWLSELHRMGYKTRPMFLNSAAFGIPQTRDRVFIVCWDERMRAPNLDHHVYADCPDCGAEVIAVQTFRKPTKAWPLPEWGKLGKQYDYCCTDCGARCDLRFTPASSVIDWSELGTRIGDRVKPLAESTMKRIERALVRWGGQLPQVLDYQATSTPIDQPTSTITTAETHALMSGVQMVVAGNTHERPGSHCRTRTLNELTWAQHTTPSIGMAVVPMRKHTIATLGDEPTFTMTAQQRPGLVQWGSAWAKNNGPAEANPYHETTDPFGTITTGGKAGIDPTSLIQAPAGPVDIDDVYFRMLLNDEVRRIMGYPDDWKAVRPDGTEPTKGETMRLLGDGVTPPPLTYCTNALLEIL